MEKERGRRSGPRHDFDRRHRDDVGIFNVKGAAVCFTKDFTKSIGWMCFTKVDVGQFVGRIDFDGW